MRQRTQQHGVGLVEVLVAVLLLSVAVLGFSALQMRAISATDESLVRTKSLTIVRNLAEIMRAYPEAYVIGSGTSYESTVSTDTREEPSTEIGVAPTIRKALPTVQAVINSPATYTVTIDNKSISTLTTGNNCLSTEVKIEAGKKVPKQSCNVNQLAARDALMIKKMAVEEDIEVDIVTCPGSSAYAIQQQMCVITAWNSTKAMLDDSDADACANTDGIYKTGSDCQILEAY